MFVRIHLKMDWALRAYYNAKIELVQCIFILDVFFQVLPVVKEKGFVVQHHMELLAAGIDLLMVDHFPIFLVQGLVVSAFLNYNVY